MISEKLDHRLDRIASRIAKTVFGENVHPHLLTLIGLLINVGAAICLGSTTSKISPFYTAGIEQVVEKIREKAPDKIRSAASLKDEIKQLSIKPFL